ncbi:putative ankyrin repeat domain-containing protein 27 isoform [Sesbania bispinosa]|nr:putative ankyrin repeat domain-containing protein 27 isoform [Sesbania bispinosa]
MAPKPNNPREGNERESPHSQYRCEDPKGCYSAKDSTTRTLPLHLASKRNHSSDQVKLYESRAKPGKKMLEPG